MKTLSILEHRFGKSSGQAVDLTLETFSCVGGFSLESCARLRNDGVGFEARFEVDMGDFGLDFVKQNPGVVGPEVQLIVSLECKR